jgi:hypothetical protein
MEAASFMFCALLLSFTEEEEKCDKDAACAQANLSSMA